jgi:hypothetical protein
MTRGYEAMPCQLRVPVEVGRFIRCGTVDLDVDLIDDRTDGEAGRREHGRDLRDLPAASGRRVILEPRPPQEGAKPPAGVQLKRYGAD